MKPSKVNKMKNEILVLQMFLKKEKNTVTFIVQVYLLFTVNKNNPSFSCACAFELSATVFIGSSTGGAEVQSFKCVLLLIHWCLVFARRTHTHRGCEEGMSA